MFGSVVLEVIIGLVFIYLVLSLICTNINEWIATITRLRANTLEHAIMSMVNDTAMVTEIYNHPRIRILADNILYIKRPSYIPAPSLAIALVDVIKARCPEQVMTVPRNDMQQITQGADMLPDGPLKTLILNLITSANNLDQLYKALEQWFDSSMDRVTGWYKRKIQIIALAVAAILSIALNADSLDIINTLYYNSNIRAIVMNSVNNYDGSLAQLPLGWGAHLNCFNAFDWLRKSVGWTLTACAISLGSSFWFDVLNKFMNFRFTGKKPD